MFAKLSLIAVAALLVIPTSSAESKLLLLQSPTLSNTQIAFVYGGDIWTVPREGGAAQRLVTGTDLETGPIFSPDGSMVAYSGDYDGNIDVYVVPSTGGEPRRLTYHPGQDIAVGWTPDGKNVLFASFRTSNNDPHHLFTVPVGGGFPTQLPLDMAEDGSYSPDGTHIAYVPIFQWEPDWKGYRGGQTTPVWIANLADSSVVKIQRDNSNDGNPMWVGNTVYFLSDRDGARTLFAYDTESQKVTRVIDNHGFDITSASAGPGAIVYSQFGVLHLYDLKSHTDQEVHVTVSADMPQLLPHWVKVADQIQNPNISPTGERAVFQAHGEILTVPAEKGDIRNITNTPGVAEREPAWSPDGKWISYFSDASGEYELHIRDQKGLTPPKIINLGKPSFYYSPVWSPDSKKIAYADKFLNLWYVDIDHPTPVKIDTSEYDQGFENDLREAWSADGQWIAYTKLLANEMHAVFVYSLATKKVTQITDGMSDCSYPRFDKSGKYLYFLASTNTGLSAYGLDMTSDEHPVTQNVYVVVLRKDLPSPIPPESDDEKAADDSSNPTASAKADEAKKPAEKDSKKPKPAPKVEIDFDGILQRILALPIPAANYSNLQAGKDGEIYFTEGPVVQTEQGPPQLSIKKFDLKSRKVVDIVAGGVQGFALSSNGEKILFSAGSGHGGRGRHWFIADASKPVQAGKGMLKTDGMEVHVVPREEWNQMYHEVWRIERDFFYDTNYHGYDIAAAQKEFAAYLPGLASRQDLNFLFRQMLSYMSVGHMFVNGGEEPDTPKVSVGLLGADYAIDNGRYRFAKIYNGENWNPDLNAPLTQPGVNVKTGEYLLAVNGRELKSSDNIYDTFQETAGKQTMLRVGPSPDDTGSREVTVVPVPNDRALRHLDWIENNRRLVDKLSDGKLAYVYLPDTGGGGYTSFNRYFFAQVGKQGAILDERFNHGGQIADYIIDYLNRKPEGLVFPRNGKSSFEPTMAIFGPKVMIINQFAGSGGDAMPWLFRKESIGTLVGMRTWGGLVGIGGYPTLIDGGSVTAPRTAIGGLNGHWEVEGHGIPPDIEVWQDPKLIREGHDPQLEKAVAVALEQLKEHPLPTYPKPPYPNHHPHLPPLPQ
ncbi:MAG TPA: PDZ domain-containing protein [Acidobacteriaceae bacterium]|nr:PDZ domain-containing protein [Acidobacteriaceae bacterium]